jgi:hypothetical protein
MIAAAIPAYRLVKARFKRGRMQRAEFMVEPEPKPSGAQCSALWETVSRLEGGD